MKERTREAASFLRIIAGIIMFLCAIPSVALIVFGGMDIVFGISNIITIGLSINGLVSVFYGVGIFIWGLLLYAILYGFSVIVENSDRTAI